MADEVVKEKNFEGKDAKGRWLPGNKGNPHPTGGRKGYLEQRARQATNDGQDLLDFWLGVMRNQIEKMEYRLRASEHIATWGFVKPKDGTEHDVSDRLFALLTRFNNTE